MYSHISAPPTERQNGDWLAKFAMAEVDFGVRSSLTREAHLIVHTPAVCEHDDESGSSEASETSVASALKRCFVHDDADNDGTDDLSDGLDDTVER